MAQLGLAPEQTRYLGEFGHHGQNDQILSLELAIEENRLKKGDLVLMISAGIGYAWNASSSIDFSVVYGLNMTDTSGYNVTIDHSQLNFQFMYSYRFGK